MLCQNEKKRIPLTQRNLAMRWRNQLDPNETARTGSHSRTGRKGLRSLATQTQNIARQLSGSAMAPEQMGADVLQAETDTRVVHDADVGVARVAREATFLVRSRGFEDHRGDYQ